MSQFDVRSIQEEYLYKYHYDDFFDLIDRLKKCALTRSISIDGKLENWTANDLKILEAYLTICGFTVYINKDNCNSNYFKISLV